MSQKTSIFIEYLKEEVLFDHPVELTARQTLTRLCYPHLLRGEMSSCLILLKMKVQSKVFFEIQKEEKTKETS